MNNNEIIKTSDYKIFIQDIKSRIQSAQIKASVAVNQELLLLYWYIGDRIVAKQKESAWGDGFLQQMSGDLQSEFPDLKGFSKRNLEIIRQWYRFWVADSAIAKQLVSQIPWGQNIVIMSKSKSQAEALFYAQKTMQNNWPRSVLAHHMESGLFQREKVKLSNQVETRHCLVSTAIILFSPKLKQKLNATFEIKPHTPRRREEIQLRVETPNLGVSTDFLFVQRLVAQTLYSQNQLKYLLQKTQTASGESIDLSQNQQVKQTLQNSQTPSAKLRSARNEQTRRGGILQLSNQVETRHCLVSTASIPFSLKLKQNLNATFEIKSHTPRRKEEIQLRVETPNLGVSTALISHSPLTKPPQSHFAPTTHHQKNKYRNESA